MIGFVLRAGGLLIVYLLVLTSLDPGDIALGAILATALIAAAHRPETGPTAGWARWAVALVMTLLTTARDMAVGTIRVVRFCFSRSSHAGFVEIPREDRSRRAVALWGVLTGEAPDEYPVDIDDARDVLIVHVVDARDPDGVKARHARFHERWQRHVVE